MVKRQESGKTPRYFVTQACSCPDSPVEHEVSKADYVNAERRAGFYNTLGQPQEPATGSFSATREGMSISGRIVNEAFSRPAAQEPTQ